LDIDIFVLVFVSSRGVCRGCAKRTAKHSRVRGGCVCVHRIDVPI
jgi:hypothetical protein